MHLKGEMHRDHVRLVSKDTIALLGGHALFS